MGPSAFEISIILLCRNYGIAPWDYFVNEITPFFMASSGILKIHVIAPEYKHYAVFLE